MELVVDANVLFAALIKEGKTAELLFNNRLILFAPEFLFEEFERYEGYILKKTKRSRSDFQRMLSILKKRIATRTRDLYEQQLKRAERISDDPKDVDYLALALEIDAGIWSNDKALKKQEEINVFTTEELVEMVEGNKYEKKR